MCGVDVPCGSCGRERVEGVVLVMANPTPQLVPSPHVVESSRPSVVLHIMSGVPCVIVQGFALTACYTTGTIGKTTNNARGGPVCV